ncbi:MAG: hypothetical protein MHM6MM_000744 [Cercozoa sp. M6MM]
MSANGTLSDGALNSPPSRPASSTSAPPASLVFDEEDAPEFMESHSLESDNLLEETPSAVNLTNDEHIGLGTLGTDDDEEETLLSQRIDEEAKNARLWHIAAWRPYFNVSTRTVQQRLLRVFDLRKPFFDEQVIGVRDMESNTTTASPAGDLYAPFWLATSLVLVVSALGNLSSYVTLPADCEVDWRTDYGKLTLGASLFYSFVSWVPALVALCARRTGFELGTLHAVSLYPCHLSRGMDALYMRACVCVCVCGRYGYALLPLLPAAVLSLVPSAVLRWLVLLLACTASFLFIMRNMRGASPPILGLVAAIHAVMALLLRIYFFSFSAATCTVKD